jgi:hypothetical protein
VAELQIDGVTGGSNNSGSKSKNIVIRLVKLIADKVIQKATNAIGVQSKVRKVDQKIDSSTSDDRNAIQRVVSKFWFGQEDPKESKMVTDITENAASNLLIVGVSDYKRSSVIEIYDLNQGGFKLLNRIPLSEISNTIKDRINQELPSNSEILKFHLANNNELAIFLEKGPMITLQITLTEVKP